MLFYHETNNIAIENAAKQEIIPLGGSTYQLIMVKATVIKSISNDSKAGINTDFFAMKTHSHSMVEVGFGERSYRTRFTPLTSDMMRSVILWSRG